MNGQTLRQAIKDAKRFLKLANEVLVESESDTSLLFITGSKTTGACKRASMDLTRSLAEMRKSN